MSEKISTQRVRIGVRVPCVGTAIHDPGIGRIASLSEKAGVDGVWVNDHLVMPSEIKSPYPFGETAWWSTSAPWHEAFVSASFAAANTERCDIGIATLILPQRDLITVSKTAATLDVLSNGRFVLGVGAGWLAEEMTALGHDFKSRGPRLEEMISALRATWTGRPNTISNEHVRLPPDLVFEPRPTSTSGVPIMVGGVSRAALRRAAHLGDGWLAFAAGHDFDGPALRAKVNEVRRLRAAGPRSERPFRAVVCLVTSELAKTRLPQIAAELAACGFDEIAIDPPWNDLDRSMGIIEQTLQNVVKE